MLLWPERGYRIKTELNMAIQHRRGPAQLWHIRQKLRLVIDKTFQHGHGVGHHGHELGLDQDGIEQVQD